MHYYEIIFSWLEGLEIKLSFAFFAAYMSFNFGANEYLLMLVQYLFLADFFFGMIDATKRKRFSWSRMWQGIRKISSLYFSVLVIGFGTRSFDVAISHQIEIDYNGKFFFNLFIYLLIVFELASINRHLARLDFSVNKNIDIFFRNNQGALTAKVQKMFVRLFGVENVELDISNSEIKSETNTEPKNPLHNRRKTDKIDGN